MTSILLFQDKPDDLGNDTLLRAATNLLNDPEEPVVVAACTIFRNLSISNEGVLLIAKRDDVVEKITLMLTSQPIRRIPLPILSLAVEILANLTRVFKGASVCMQFPLVAPVLELLKKAVLYPVSTIHHAVLVISNAATHDQGKREAIHLEAVEICLKVLSKVLLSQSIKCESEEIEVELTRALIGAVMGLSTYEDAKPRVIEFGVEPLVACLRHKSAAVSKNASIAINSACELPLGALHFAQRLLSDKTLLIQVLGVKAIPAINKSLVGLDEDDKLCALNALVELVEQEPEAANEVVQCLDMVDNLIALLADPQREIHQRVVDVLHTMTQVRQWLVYQNQELN